MLADYTGNQACFSPFNQLGSEEVKLIPVPLALAGWQEQKLRSNRKSLEGGFVASP